MSGGHDGGWRRVAANRFLPMPWRNGGGTTWEIARGSFPDAAPAGWHWRFSLAEIAADGPFSVFPAVDRWLVVVRGEGVALTVGSAPPRLLRLRDDIQFPGDAPAGCVLLAGPTRDLNLMVDRRVARLVPGGDDRRIAAAAGDVVVLYALEETALRIEAGRIDLEPGDALIGEGETEAAIESGFAAWARIERLAPQ